MDLSWRQKKQARKMDFGGGNHKRVVVAQMMMTLSLLDAARDAQRQLSCFTRSRLSLRVICSAHRNQHALLDERENPMSKLVSLRTGNVVSHRHRYCDEPAVFSLSVSCDAWCSDKSTGWHVCTALVHVCVWCAFAIWRDLSLLVSRAGNTTACSTVYYLLTALHCPSMPTPTPTHWFDGNRCCFARRLRRFQRGCTSWT